MNIDPCEIRSIVRLVTRRTGWPLHDEDLVQDATLKAVEAFRRQLEVRYPRAFLHKVVCDAVHDYWRRRRTPEDLTAVCERHIAEPPRFEERLDADRRIDSLRKGLAQLDAAKRSLLELYYVEERSISEIAGLQNKSVSAIKMELCRARRRLAEIVLKLAEKRPGF